MKIWQLYVDDVLIGEYSLNKPWESPFWNEGDDNVAFAAMKAREYYEPERKVTIR